MIDLGGTIMKNKLKLMSIIGLSSLLLAGCGNQNHEDHASSHSQTTTHSTSHHQKSTAKESSHHADETSSSTAATSDSSATDQTSSNQAAQQSSVNATSSTQNSSQSEQHAINSVQEAIAAVDAKYGNGDIQWSYMSEGNGTMATDEHGQPAYWIRGQDSAYRNGNYTAGSYDGHDYYVYPDGRIVPREGNQ